MFSVHGHGSAVRMLEAGLRQGRLHHAYLLSGPDHIGKTTLALQLAQAVNCDDADDACRERIAAGLHADVQAAGVDSSGDDGPRTLIGIDAIRGFIASAHLRPYEGRVRVFTIHEADRLGVVAANALLKLLEEPPPDVLLLLLTENPEGVLPTVRSRCQLVELRPLAASRVTQVLRDEYEVGPEQAELLARLSRGCLGWAIEAARDPTVLAGVHQRLEKIAYVAEGGLESRFTYADELARRFQRDRAAGRGELFLWLRWVRDLLLIQQGQGVRITHITWRETLERQARSLSPAQTVSWLQRISETIEALEYNANPRLALEVLMLDTPELPAPTAEVLPDARP